jgi:hypothetical protein
MGQYFNPTSIERKEHVYSHDFGNGLKLMEHSYIGNNFVAVVENLIAKGGHWYGDKIVWAGDYADPEEGTEENLYSICGENKIPVGLVSDVRNKKNRYLINMDTKEFVDMKKVPVSHTFEDGETLVIHPLPLLTCEGNGRGGGDFRGSDPKNLIGKWARCWVTIQKTKPKNGIELIFDLTEN